MDLIATAQEYWEIVDSMDWWIRLIVGLSCSVIAGALVQIIAKGPVMKLISKSDNKYDDAIFDLATPLINAGIILFGMWLTLVWVFEGTSTNSMLMSTLVILILLFMVARFLSQGAEIFVPIGLENLNKRAGVDLEGVESLLLAALKVAIWAGAAMVIMAQLNIDITGFLASATIISLVVGMALQETASNLVSGLLMMMDKPFEQGDKVTVMGITGKVVDVGIMSTKIKTGFDHLVVIPNKTISGKEVVNFARGGSSDSPKRVNLRLDIEVGYDEQPAHVKQMLLAITRKCDYVVDDPEPTALFMNMLGSSLQFRLNCWVRDYADEWVARDWLLTNILQECIDQGIDIPYPHMQLKYDPASVAEQKAADEASDSESRAAEKKRAQDAARKKDKKETDARMKERKKMRDRIDELQQLLDSTETSDEDELSEDDAESRLSIIAEITELELKLNEGGGDADD
ncbi:MAG: mechanosensitive ion channel [Candidatus Thalassarchaeaceae archaeon]|jgi:small-conductance mechanosensitive channel|nr:mechanosensitive ion channel [Candidatus Thalassarchaeaceae archaeon]